MELKEIPLVQRRRFVLYDVLANPEDICSALGLPPISPEVADQERKDSIARITPLVAFDIITNDHCGFLASMFISMQRQMAEAALGEGVTAVVTTEEWEHLQDQLHHMLQSALVSGITLLVEMGALTYASEEPP